MNIAIIPARGGSKRIPRKNIRLFHGKPIIEYPIQAALESGCFDHVIVSTDDHEIADIAAKAGALVPFIRPADLSNDTAGTLDVIKHGLSHFISSGVTPEFACCIYPATPMLSAELLRQGLIELRKAKADFCISVTPYEHPIQRALYLHKGEDYCGLLPMYPEFMAYRSQDLPETFHDAGQFYWGSVSSFLSEKSFFSGNTAPIIVDRSLYIDIDHEDDWRRAEHVFQTHLGVEIK